jgi:hypothetical protein
MSITVQGILERKTYGIAPPVYFLGGSVPLVAFLSNKVGETWPTPLTLKLFVNSELVLAVKGKLHLFMQVKAAHATGEMNAEEKFQIGDTDILEALSKHLGKPCKIQILY